MILLVQYNTLLSDMETKYSVAEVCRANGTCHPLDPGRNQETRDKLNIKSDLVSLKEIRIHIFRPL